MLEVEMLYKLQIKNRVVSNFEQSVPTTTKRSFLLIYTTPTTFLFLKPCLKARKASGVSYLHSQQRLCWQPDGRGKEQRPLCSSGSHMKQCSGAGGTWTNSCMPTYSIKDDWNESLLPMAVVFYSNSALCFAQTLQIDISFTEVYEEKRVPWFYRINCSIMQ